MTSFQSLLQPEECVLLMVDYQAGLAFGVESVARQTLINNAVAVARTATVFSLPVVASTSASRVYSGPLFPSVQAVIPGVTPMERHNMNAWEDDAVHSAVLATGRRRLLIAGLLTEACVSFPALSALQEGFDVSIIADACGGMTPDGHQLALRRLETAGARLTSWLQVLLELQRDWTRHETYAGARSIVEQHAGGYGMGLVYAGDMIHPTPA